MVNITTMAIILYSFNQCKFRSLDFEILNNLDSVIWKVLVIFQICSGRNIGDLKCHYTKLNLHLPRNPRR